MKLPQNPLDLPARALALSGGILGLSLVYFMILPLLALYLSVGLDSAPSQIGAVLAVLTISNQGLQLFVGVLADRFGDRSVLAIGTALAFAGYLGFAAGPPFALQFLCAAGVGLGNATTSLLGKAMLADAAAEKRAQAFALRAVAVNGGAALGPIVGGVMFGMFEIALVCTAVIYLLFWVVLVRNAPARSGNEEQPRNPLSELVDLFRVTPLVGQAVASIGFWYLYTQLTFTLPLYANDRFDLEGRVAVLFTVEALVTVALQFPLVSWLSNRTDSWRIINLGAIGLIGAFLAITVIPSGWGLVVFVVIFAVGALLVVPTLDTLASEYAPPSALAGSLGLVSLGWAAGGLLGNLGGGMLYQVAQEADRYELFWGTNTAIGVLVLVAFVLLRRWVGDRRPSSIPTEERQES